MIQIDGTPFDWLNTGQLWTLHLAVDDATTEVLAGWFLPTERQLGYCRIMNLIVSKLGTPKSIYSDKHTIFKSKENNFTQFGLMMNDLGIKMIFANSSEAKGRIERYNGTAQMRLPNDIIRNNINSYDELNIRFNEYYISYLNKKFSFLSLDPNDSFQPLYDDFDLYEIFTIRYYGIINNSTFSLNGIHYSPVNENGEVYFIRSMTEVSVRINVFSLDIFILYRGLILSCIPIRYDRRKSASNSASNQKELDQLLKNNDLL